MIRKESLLRRMRSTRVRTLALLNEVPAGYFKRRVHGFYSPIGWHFGHIARTEEYWVSRAVGVTPQDESLGFIFSDVPENPKDNRVNIPPMERVVDYLNDTRSFAVSALESTDIESTDEPLTLEGYAWEFALQHECQHQETILELLCLIHQDARTTAKGTVPEWRPEVVSEDVHIDGGPFVMGSDDWCAYDNEKKAHSVVVAPFVVDKHPVTAYQWSEFTADAGYLTASLWSEKGWEWCASEDVRAPEYWKLVDGARFIYGPRGLRPVHPDEPVASVSWHEAEAFANWAGRRLLTERERELLMRDCPSREGDPDFCAPPVSVRSQANGLACLIGCIWEWTASAFLPYPGFEPFPYDGYSTAHMDGSHRVCKGGSWATADAILRPSFRNWYVPEYRQGFLGLRLARLV